MSNNKRKDKGKMNDIKKGRKKRRRNGGAEGASQSAIMTLGGKMKKDYIFSGSVGRDDGDLWTEGVEGRGHEGSDREGRKARKNILHYLPNSRSANLPP